MANREAAPQVTWNQVRRFRMERSGLLTPFATAEDAARALVGIQAQIHPAAGLALQNRTPAGKAELTDARFDALLFDERSLVKLWGQRGTLHVYAISDWPILTAARAENLTWWEKNPPDTKAQAHPGISGSAGGSDDTGEPTEASEGDDAVQDAAPAGGAASAEAVEAATQRILQAMRSCESMGRSEVRAMGLDLPEDYFSPWGGIFSNLVRAGWICHARRVGNEGHFAHREVWTPNLEWNPPEPDAANADMGRRYFAAYGPATRADFMYWRHPRPAVLDRALRDLQPELTTVLVEGESMFMLRSDVDALLAQPADPDAMPVRMLYRFDPLLLGHRYRTWVIDPEYAVRVSRLAGHIEGVVLDRGKIVATWRYVRKGKGLIISVEPFGKLRKPVQRALPKHAARVARYFRIPLQEFVYGEDTTIYPGRGRTRKQGEA